MDLFRLDTNNAINLYVRYPSRSHILDVLRTFDAWPYMVRGANAGLPLAVVDVARERHGVQTGGLMETVGVWLTRKSTPATSPTWNDYWHCRWTLTQNTELAAAALAELHRRAWHLDHQADPKWLSVEESARSLIRLQSAIDPDFHAAIIAEISTSPCGRHDGVGIIFKHERARL